jgi:hypothetical protein
LYELTRSMACCACCGKSSRGSKPSALGWEETKHYLAVLSSLGAKHLDEKWLCTKVVPSDGCRARQDESRASVTGDVCQTRESPGGEAHCHSASLVGADLLTRTGDTCFGISSVEVRRSVMMPPAVPAARPDTLTL